MTVPPTDQWRTRLRTSLLAARKDRDTARISALRSALGAIDNAETPEGPHIDASLTGKIAGAVAGVGAAEVARRQLSDAQIRELLRAEVDERLSAAGEFTAGAHDGRAETLRAEAAILTDLLGNV
jgi:uncharacterized protein